VRVTSPEHARRLGIAMVFQHFSLFETLTVAENVWLGLDEPSREAVARRIRELGKQYGIDVNPDRPVHALSVGERQSVEIVRALLSKPQLLILDEPTSVLAPQAIEPLFTTLRLLARGGCSILYISHKLDEIRALCQRCTVLRAGKVTGTVADPASESNASLSRLMLGAEPPPLAHHARDPGDLVLNVRQLSLEKQEHFGVSLQDVCLSVRSGEVLGIAGVSGNGQNELLAALAGEDTRAARGTIELFGRDATESGPRERRKLGVHFVPEERLGRATVPTHALSANAMLTREASVPSGPFFPRRSLGQLTERIIERFGVKARGASAPARSLSGGNLQKYVVGRELDAQPKLLLVAQPTWGVDVGAAAHIRSELLRLRDSGAALLVVSEDLDELFELCDGLVVMAKGKLSPRLARSAATREQVGAWMSGLWQNAERSASAEARAEA
jgi:ABC-type uncharacterized transport system ATPase subunit